MVKITHPTVKLMPSSNLHPVSKYLWVTIKDEGLIYLASVNESHPPRNS